MKVIATILLIACCAFAQYDTGTGNDSHKHLHKGFFFSFSMAPTYTYLRHAFYEKEADGMDIEIGKFSAVLLYEEIRLGYSFSNKASIYGALGFSHGEGSYEDEMLKTGKEPREASFEEEDDEAFRFLFGIGGEFYPIQDKGNPVYGLFFGATLGLVLDHVSYTDHSYETIYEGEKVGTMFANFYGRLEVGKDWWFRNHWSFGVAFNYTYGFYEGDYTDTASPYTNTESHVNHSTGLTFRIAH